MKKLVCAGLIFLVHSVSFAGSIGRIKSIECVDAGKNKKLKVYFTTSHSGAEKYVRRSDTIPFSYGNSLASTTKTGQMKESKNNGRVTVLFEDDGFDLSVLELRPRNEKLFDGLLSGSIEDLEGHWVPIQKHALLCRIEFR